jgi:hypothetical protein
MKDNTSINKVIKAQKAVIAGLKREIFGVDKSSRSRYIRDFLAELGGYSKICTREDVIDKALNSDIIYFGDYHPLHPSQTLALDMIRELSERGAKVILALEMLYEYQQETLDRWMKGTITEDEFLEAIDYYSEWGFSWESYRRFFESAKDPFVPIFGIDSEPRDSLSFIRRRDRFFARRIASIRSFFPDHVIFVVIGESHLASRHLPAEVRKIMGRGIRETTIVQNVDELYWKLLRKRREDTEAILIDKGRYCIFTASPIMKYESYRQIIDEWVEGSDFDPCVSLMNKVADNILNFLVGGTDKLVVRLGPDWKEPVKSVFPEVECRKTYKSFASFMRSRKVSQRGVLAARENIKRLGMTYMPCINTLLMLKQNVVGIAYETTRFIIYAMRGELDKSGKIRRTNEDRFYAFLFEEALCRFGTRIVNPKLDFDVIDPLAEVSCMEGVIREPLPGLTIRATREVERLYRYFIAREGKARGRIRSTEKLRSLFKMGIRKRLWIVKALGSRLGDAIYRGYQEGEVTHEQVLSLFSERFDEPGRGAGLYMDWIDATGPFLL